MQKNIKKTTDFFKLYRSNQLHKYIMSGSIAVFAAFTIVAFTHGDMDMKWLMASVSSVTEAPRSDADFIMTQKDTSLIFTFGAKATNVDQINFTILSDPTRIHSLVSTNPAISVTWEKDTGLYNISVDMHSTDIAPGTNVAQLTVNMDPGTPIAITDTEFVSAGQKYSLTSKWE